MVSLVILDTLDILVVLDKIKKRPPDSHPTVDSLN